MLYFELSEDFEIIKIMPTIYDAKRIQLIYVGGTIGSVLSDIIDGNHSYSNFGDEEEAKPTSNLSVIGHENADNPIFEIPRSKGEVLSQIKIGLIRGNEANPKRRKRRHLDNPPGIYRKGMTFERWYRKKLRVRIAMSRSDVNIVTGAQRARLLFTYNQEKREFEEKEKEREGGKPNSNETIIDCNCFDDREVVVVGLKIFH